MTPVLNYEVSSVKRHSRSVLLFRIFEGHDAVSLGELLL